MKTSISFLKNNKLNEKAVIKAICETDTDFIHVDVMDGIFVKNRTFDIEEVAEFTEECTKALDIHLMTNKPRKYIKDIDKMLKNVAYITIHAEIDDDLEEYIDLIHKKGMNAGIAINPETDVVEIGRFLNDIEYVLIMGVTPGAGGQELIISTTNKIKELVDLRDNYNYHYMISFDGGVNAETREYLDGLDIVVSGSYVCMSNDYQKRIDTLR